MSVIPIRKSLDKHTQIIPIYSGDDAPIKVNPGGSRHMKGGRSDYTGESDNSYSFQHHSHITKSRNIDLFKGNSDSES